MNIDVSTNKSGVITITMSKNGDISLSKEILPMEALYYADLLHFMANNAIKHNSPDDDKA